MSPEPEKRSDEEKIEKLAKWLDVQFGGPQIGNQVRAVGAALAASRADNERQRIEMERLYEIAFVHAGCERYRISGNEHLIRERDAARVEVSQLRAQLEAIHVLHAISYEDVSDEVWETNQRCAECRAAYPCDTLRALVEPLGSTENPPANEENR